MMDIDVMIVIYIFLFFLLNVSILTLQKSGSEIIANIRRSANLTMTASGTLVLAIIGFTTLYLKQVPKIIMLNIDRRRLSRP